MTKLFTIDISLEIVPFLLFFNKPCIISSGSSVIPIHDPLINILFLPLISDGWTSLNFAKFGKVSNVSWIILAGVPTETNVIKDKFLTKPHAWPSGVSAGHSIPQWVLCNCLGFVIFPVFSKGVLSLLKWDKYDMKVNLCKTWATPVFWTWPTLFWPQFPVAKEYFIPFVIIFLSKADSKTIFFSLLFFIWSFILDSTFFANFLNNCLKIPDNKTPDISSLFLP